MVDLPPNVRLALIFGGRSAEHEVSCVSAAQVLRAIDQQRYEVTAVGITAGGTWVIDDTASTRPEKLTAAGPQVDPFDAVRAADVVFPLVHGPLGEDGTLQGLLEQAGAAYVGAGVLGSALAMDKAMAKVVLAQAGIPQARFVAYRDTDIDGTTAGKAAADLGLPVFVKPANLGSSVGITKAHDHDELVEAIDLALSYDEFVVIEEAVDGREIECAVLGDTHPEASLPGEIRSSHEFYDYEDKYVDGTADLVVPAELPEGVTADLREMAVATYRALRIEGMARVDFFYEPDGRGLLVNEVNTLPGFTPVSMYPMMWEATGLAYPDLIDRLVELALARHRRRSGRIGRVDRMVEKAP